MILLVMCELKSSASLAPFHEAIRNHGPSCRFYDSFFLVATDKSPIDLQRALHLHVDGNATVYVSQLCHEHAGYLPQAVLDWIACHRNHGSDVRPHD